MVKVKQAIHEITLFHGTSARNLPNILRNGILAQSPPNTFAQTKAVYLTPDVNRAAGYTHNLEYPVVLEIRLSGDKRVKSLTHDLLDREEDEFDSYRFWDDDAHHIEEKIGNILGYVPKSITNLFNDEPSSGDNLYKLILEAVRADNMLADNKTDIEGIKRKMFAEFPPGEDIGEYFSLATDGTIKFTEYIYSNMHQLEYPKNIPAAAIKGVWIPENNLKEDMIQYAIDKQSVGKLLLIGTVNSYNNAIRSLFGETYGKDVQATKEYVLETLEDYPDSLTSDIKEEIADIESMEDLKELLSSVDFIDPGETIDYSNWYKFETTIETISQVPSLYKEAQIRSGLFDNIQHFFKLSLG